MYLNTYNMSGISLTENKYDIKIFYIKNNFKYKVLNVKLFYGYIYLGGKTV